MNAAIAVVAATLLSYAVVERFLRRTPVTGAIVFTAVGLLASGQVTGLITPSRDGPSATIVLELTLVIVLFTDAMAIHVSAWATQRPLPSRLLGIGLPLTIVMGWLLALPLIPGIGIAEAAVLAAVLAPTDSALGLPVITNEGVPLLIRNALNIEGGLNDGLVLPFVTIFLAVALEDENAVGSGNLLLVFLRAIVASAAIGAAIGLAGTLALRWSMARGWSGRHWRSVALLSMAALSFAVADAIDGSGFIAAWVAGFAAGSVSRGTLGQARQTPEELANIGTSVSFLLFGAVFLAPALANVTWQAAVYALLSLSVIRIVPVVVSLLGSGLAWQTAAYLGWFGPRGLASIVFADLVATSGLPKQGLIVNVVMLTVAMSVLLHGATAHWGAQRYATWFARAAARRPDLPEAAGTGHFVQRLRVSQDTTGDSGRDSGAASDTSPA